MGSYGGWKGRTETDNINITEFVKRLKERRFSKKQSGQGLREGKKGNKS